MKDERILSVSGAGVSPAGRVNLFVHGYRSLDTAESVASARARIAACGVPGDNYLLDWAAGGWRRSLKRNAATLTGLRTAYRIARLHKALSPWMILVDAGVISLAEVAEFKLMEKRAERVGGRLPGLLRPIAAGRPVNLIGHSLGARVVHRMLAEGDLEDLVIDDCVFLGGAADLGADDWPDCLARIRGRLFNAYSPSDRVLKITPDLRRRVGGRPMPQVVIDGAPRVLNHRCEGVSHVGYWLDLQRVLPRVWPGHRGAPA